MPYPISTYPTHPPTLPYTSPHSHTPLHPYPTPTPCPNLPLGRLQINFFTIFTSHKTLIASEKIWRTFGIGETLLFLGVQLQFSVHVKLPPAISMTMNRRLYSITLQPVKGIELEFISIYCKGMKKTPIFYNGNDDLLLKPLLNLILNCHTWNISKKCQIFTACWPLLANG